MHLLELRDLVCVELQELEEVEQEAAYVDLVLGELLTGGGGEVALMLCSLFIHRSNIYYFIIKIRYYGPLFIVVTRSL